MPAIGTVMNLVNGTIELSLTPVDKYWFIQSQSSIAAIDVTVPGLVGGPRLNPGLAAGLAGDWIDSNMFPFMPSSITLTSTDLTAQFAAWSSPCPPTGFVNLTGLLPTLLR